MSEPTDADRKAFDDWWHQYDDDATDPRVEAHGHAVARDAYLAACRRKDEEGEAMRMLFVYTGEAYVAAFAAIQKAVQTRDPIAAMMGLVESLDGKTLAQHWHDAKAALARAAAGREGDANG